jgi:hypothetical protein
MNEIEKQEEAEQAEVICADCPGQMNFVNAPHPNPANRLFGKKHFTWVCLSCNHCKKTGKVIAVRNKKK